MLLREEADELDEPLGRGDSDETTVLLREEMNELGDPLGSGEVDKFEVPLGGGGVDELEVPLGKDEDVLLVKFGSQLPLPVSVTEEVVPPVVPVATDDKTSTNSQVDALALQDKSTWLRVVESRCIAGVIRTSNTVVASKNCVACSRTG